MTAREDTIERIERVLNQTHKKSLTVTIQRLTAERAASMLKEQEPKPMIEVEDDDLYAWSPEDVSYYCPRPECGKEISYDYNFCPYCGQAVKLDG